MNWDEFYFRQVYLYAAKSKDPRTQVGAIIVNLESRTILSGGYNGFPRRVADFTERYETRESKLALIVHAELNAILNCARNGISTNHTVMYTNGFPCNDCSKPIIQAGIKFVYVHKEWHEMFFQRENWNKSHDLAKQNFREANIPVKFCSFVLGVKIMIDGQLVEL